MTVPALDVLRSVIVADVYDVERPLPREYAALADLDALVQAATAMLDWERDPMTGEPPDGAGKALDAALARVTGEART